MRAGTPLLFDLRALRTRFLDKKLAYALSYSYGMTFAGWRASSQVTREGAGRAALRMAFSRPRTALGHPKSSCGQSFHVLGSDRVPGIDGLGHDVPIGFRVASLLERVTFDDVDPFWSHAAGQAPATTAFGCTRTIVNGRFLLTTPFAKRSPGVAGPRVPQESLDGGPLRIAVTYDGTLLPDTELGAADDSPPKAFSARAFMNVFFDTAHPKYHWLTESACFAFGTWRLREDHTVRASFDIYSVGVPRPLPPAIPVPAPR
jgi:hypothetical protein